MRVTDNQLYGNVSQQIQNAQQRVYQANERGQSLLKVQHFSDDPVAAARAVRMKRAQGELSQLGRSSDLGRMELGIADAALSEASTALLRLEELTLAAANGVAADGDLDAIAAEMSSLRDQLRSIANTQMEGGYIFAGQQRDTAPIDSDFRYTGDNGVRQVEILPGSTVDVSQTAEDIFMPTDGIDIFAQLGDLIDAVRTGTVPATAGDQSLDDYISAQIDVVHDMSTQVTAARAEVGRRMSSLDQAGDLREDLNLGIEEAYQKLVAISDVEAYSDLIQANTALQASIAQATQLLKTLDNALRG